MRHAQRKAINYDALEPLLTNDTKTRKKLTEKRKPF